MISKIAGIFWMAMGIIGFIHPKFIQDLFKKKAKKKNFKLFISFLLFFGSFALSLFFRFEGIMFKILIIIGFVALFKMFLIINSTISNKVNKYLVKINKNYYRIFAIIIIVAGFILFKFL